MEISNNMKRKAVVKNVDPQFLHKTVRKTVGEVESLGPNMLHISAAALINLNDEVLLCTRPAGKDYAGMWEFPGGKIEPMEYPEQALSRELMEELRLEVSMKDMQAFSFATHFHEEKGRYMLMYLYLIRTWQGTVKPTEQQRYTWVPLNRLETYIDDMPPIDRPLARLLGQLLKQ